MIDKIRKNLILNIFLGILTIASMVLYMLWDHAAFIMVANVCWIYWIVFFILHLVKAEREESADVGRERTLEEWEAIAEIRAERKRKRDRD